MQSRALFGLCMAVGLIAAVWNVTTAAGQNCSDSFAEPPLGPERPEDLIAFRDVVKGEGDLLQDVVLLWTNVADNARCITVEASFSTTGAAEARDDWGGLADGGKGSSLLYPLAIGLPLAAAAVANRTFRRIVIPPCRSCAGACPATHLCNRCPRR